MSALFGARSERDAGYERWLACAIIAIVAGANYDAILGLVDVWEGQHTYSHAFLTAPLIFVLILRQREQLRADPASPMLVAAIGLCALAAAVAMATLAAVTLAVYVLLPIIAWFAILGVLGRRAAAATAFPLGMLYFCLPIWGPLSLPLRIIAAWASGSVVRTLGIPVFISESVVAVPSGVFNVAEGCSGLNFFVVSIALAALFGHLQAWPWRRRALLLIVAMGLAMVANWLRVILVIVAASLTDGRSPLVHDHYAFGWGLFAACLVLMILFARHLDRRHSEARSGSSERPVGPSARTVVRRTTVVTLLIIAGPAWAALVQHAAVAPQATAPLPTRVETWNGPTQPDSDWKPSYPGAASFQLGAYTGEEGEAELLRVAYTRESRGHKLLGEDSRLEGTGGWQIVSESQAVASPGRPRWRTRESVLAAPDGRDWLVAYWYEVDGFRTSSASVVKLRETVRAFRGMGVARMTAVAVRCIATCTGDSTRRVVDAFLTALPPEYAPAAVAP